MAASTKVKLHKIQEITEKFVIKHKGVWTHDDWEVFLEKAEKLGLEMSDEVKRNLGNCLESCKFFYHMEPPAPAKRRAAPRRKKDN